MSSTTLPPRAEDVDISIVPTAPSFFGRHSLAISRASASAATLGSTAAASFFLAGSSRFGSVASSVRSTLCKLDTTHNLSTIAMGVAGAGILGMGLCRYLSRDEKTGEETKRTVSEKSGQTKGQGNNTIPPPQVVIPKV